MWVWLLGTQWEPMWAQSTVHLWESLLGWQLALRMEHVLVVLLVLPWARHLETPTVQQLDWMLAWPWAPMLDQAMVRLLVQLLARPLEIVWAKKTAH